jgi:hypothetical protein
MAIERRYRSEDPGGSEGNSKDLGNDPGNSRTLFQTSQSEGCTSDTTSIRASVLGVESVDSLYGTGPLIAVNKI